MRWTIKYYDEQVQNDILDLPDKLQARYLQLTDRMLIYGPNLGEPHTKSLKDGLFEIRMKAKEGIARAFYCTLKGKEIHILHVFVKKTQKTPPKELKLARKRLKEVKENDDA